MVSDIPDKHVNCATYTFVMQLNTGQYTFHQQTVFALKHLRFGFSFFLLPVFLFALHGVSAESYTGVALAFVLLHLMVYPASNAYNSYMDQDTESIGGLKVPPPATGWLLYISFCLDVAACMLAFWWSSAAGPVLLAYVLASRAYSWRKIRLKKYPLIGFFTVIVFQGAAVYWFVILMSSPAGIGHFLEFSGLQWTGALISSLLIASSYPLTQIYQHRQDAEDGVQTISMKLGIRGTMYFSGIVLIFFVLILFGYLHSYAHVTDIMVFVLLQLPVIVFFSTWFAEILRDESNATYAKAMRMSILGAASMNLFFIWLLIT